MQKGWMRMCAGAAAPRTFIALVALAIAMAAIVALAPGTADAQGETTKDITSYFHNVTTSRQIGDVATLLVMDTMPGEPGELRKTVPTFNSIKTYFYLYPALANDTTIEGRIAVYMWSIRTPRIGDADQVTLLYDLYDIDETGAKVAKVSRGQVTLRTVTEWRQYAIVNDTVAPYTVAKGHYMLLEYELQGSTSNWYELAWGDDNYRSHIVIESHDYLEVDRVDVRDPDGSPVTVLPADATDKDVMFRAEVVDPFGGYDARYANVTLTGPTGAVIIAGDGMARTGGYFTSYRTVLEYAWNYAGFPVGVYNLTVTSVDNSGFYYRFPDHPDEEDYGGHLESLTVLFWVGGPPQPLQVKVLDNLTRPLPGAVVTLSQKVGVTDPAGVATVMLPNDTYAMRVLWQDVPVYEGDVVVDGPTAVTVEAAVYYPSFVALDDHGDPVEDAVALLQHPNGTGLRAPDRTNASGAFGLERMAVGDYGVALLWRGSEVHSSVVAVQGNGPFTLACAVHALAVRVIDDLGDGLALAQVVMTNSTTGIVLDARLTDLDGNTSSRLPAGTYDITVWWRTRLVDDSVRGYVVNASGELVIVVGIHTLSVSAVDQAGLPLADAKLVIEFADNGQVLQFGSTDDDGALSARLAPDAYALTLYWHGVLVNETMWTMPDGHATLVLVGRVHWARFEVVDPRLLPVTSAVVGLELVPDQPFGTCATATDGSAVLRLPEGLYAVTVTWQGVGVCATEVWVGSSGPYVLLASVHYLQIVAVDTLGTSLADARISLVHTPTGRTLGDAVTGSDGGCTLRLPAGIYGAKVEWLSTTVLQQEMTVDRDAEVVLTCSVFLAPFHAIGSSGVDVEGAHVLLTFPSTGAPAGDGITGADGVVPIRLPAGAYDVRVLWRDHLVLDAQVAVGTNDAIILACSVHDVTLHVLDSAGIDLEGAHLSVRADLTGDAMGALITTTDATAHVRLPAGTFSVLVTWRDVAVLDTAIEVAGTGTITLTARVHYATLHVVDSRGAALANALLAVSLALDGAPMDTGVSDGDGNVTFRLPEATYTASVRWQDTEVLLTALDHNASGARTLVAGVFYVTFRVLDDQGLAVEDARLLACNASTAAELASAVTDANGAALLRLPVGGAMLAVTWRSVEVNSTPYLMVSADAEVTVQASVHYLTVEVRDADGARLAKVGVEVLRSGAPVAFAPTERDGLVVFRLPAGDYTVNMTFRTTYKMTAVVVRATTDVTLDASRTVSFRMGDGEYPLPMLRTVSFWVALGFVALIAVILVLAFLLLRRPKEGAPAPSSQGEDGNIELDLEEKGETRRALTGLSGEGEIEPLGDK